MKYTYALDITNLVISTIDRIYGEYADLFYMGMSDKPIYIPDKIFISNLCITKRIIKGLIHNTLVYIKIIKLRRYILEISDKNFPNQDDIVHYYREQLHTNTILHDTSLNELVKYTIELINAMFSSNNVNIESSELISSLKQIEKNIFNYLSNRIPISLGGFTVESVEFLDNAYGLILYVHINNDVVNKQLMYERL